jgi:hypothetical protein
LQDVDVQYVWRFLREHNIDLAALKSWYESNDSEFTPKAVDVVVQTTANEAVVPLRL